jgi:hypothetical protein
MGFTITEDNPDEEDFYLSVGENDRFKVKIIKIEENITRVSIRVNFMGDKPYAELLYKHIDNELGIIEFDKNGSPKKSPK